MDYKGSIVAHGEGGQFRFVEFLPERPGGPVYLGRGQSDGKDLAVFAVQDSGSPAFYVIPAENLRDKGEHPIPFALRSRVTMDLARSKVSFLHVNKGSSQQLHLASDNSIIATLISKNAFFDSGGSKWITTLGMKNAAARPGVSFLKVKNKSGELVERSGVVAPHGYNMSALEPEPA